MAFTRVNLIFVNQDETHRRYTVVNRTVLRTMQIRDHPIFVQDEEGMRYTPCHHCVGDLNKGVYTICPNEFGIYVNRNPYLYPPTL